MEQLFLCNNVDANQKVSTFVTLIGAEAYCVLKNLMSPELPSSKTYDELKNCLLKYYCSKRLVIDENEDTMAFTIKLKALSKDCAFGRFLDRAIRDKFICGVKSEAIKRKLLMEDDLTFDKVASSTELAEDQARAFAPAEIEPRAS